MGLSCPPGLKYNILFYFKNYETRKIRLAFNLKTSKLAWNTCKCFLLPDNIFPAVLFQRADPHYTARHNYVEDICSHVDCFPIKGSRTRSFMRCTQHLATKWGQQCYGTSEEGCEQEPTYPRCIPYCFVQLPILLRETFFPRHFLPQFKTSTIIFSVAKLKTEVMCLTDKRQSSKNR